jgi:hypothetical protein
MVEERHATESVSITQIVLETRPMLLSETLSDAKIMAQALDGVWTHLDRVVQNARRTIQQPKGRALSVSGPMVPSDRY